MSEPARRLTFADIQVDDVATIEQHIAADMVTRFADLSGDRSPIHVSQEAAITRGFQDQVVHGFLTGSFVSQVLGMLLPGELGLLHDISLQFKKPVYVGDTVTVIVKVVEKNDTFRLLTFAVTITNQNGQTVCKGKVTSGMAE